MNAATAYEKLSSLRAQLPGCSLVLCSDLRSGTVLASDSDLTYPQEYLDALSEAAMQLLAPFEPNQDAPDLVLVSEISGLRLFCNNAATPDLGLTCLASFDLDVAHLQSVVSDFLSALAHERVT